jgi:DNA polymerase-4/DNA polymerase V
MSANTNDPGFITLSSYPRAIVHVDCDAFFASCESARDPALRGLPIATGKERGIVSCPSYEAKASGVVRGMRLGEARRICPGLVILPSDYELYSIYSTRVFAILRRFTPQVEEYSIDEAFCDLTGLRRYYRTSYAEIARRMKETVRSELGITVSAGLGLTKSLAKICSKAHKPDGFTAVPGNRLHEFLGGVGVEKVCGFGPSSVAVLHKCGVRTVLEYVRRPPGFAEKLLGKAGRELWHELRGESVYEVSTEPKERYLSISKTKTFSPSSSDRALVRARLVRNLESAFIKLRRHGLAAGALTVYLRRHDYGSSALEARMTRRSASTLDFTDACAELFDRLFEEGVSYRTTGVVLSDIADAGSVEPDLFDDAIRIERMRRIGGAIDDINAAYGKHTLHLASSQDMPGSGEHPRNELAWRKTALLRGETFRRRLSIPLLKPLHSPLNI